MTKTVLNNRTLWYDGDITVLPNLLEQTLSSHSPNAQLFVQYVDKNVEQYNNLVPQNKQLTVKQELKSLSFKWCLPELYAGLSINEFVFAKLVEKTLLLSQEEIKIRERRTIQELKMFRERGLEALLRALIYVIETFESHSIVWGIGRGSSVASYVLFLVGVHDVDSILYDIDMTEFFKITAF